MIRACWNQRMRKASLPLLAGLAGLSVAMGGCGGDSGGGSALPPTTAPFVDPCQDISPFSELSTQDLESIRLTETRPSVTGSLDASLSGPVDSAFSFDDNGNVIEADPNDFFWFFDTYIITPTDPATESVTIELNSDDFDALLGIIDFPNGEVIDIVNDDRAEGNTNSLLTIPVEPGVCYGIFVQSFWAANATADAPGSPGLGAYTLAVTEIFSTVPPTPPPRTPKPADPDRGGNGEGGGGGGI
ncbi:MAG: hypothetical protein NW237_16940 [Cyanobacteriota bacterium]|nr:hypothetical protein [Cyanobacteriota bacterium]